MKIFITGDMGKLGSIASNKLRAQGHEVVGYDIKRDGNQDILNPTALQTAMAGCEVVIHTAAYPHPHGGDMNFYFRVNVIGTFNVLKAARSNNVRRVVYTSSTAYYGCDYHGALEGGKLTPHKFPITEDTPPANVDGHCTTETKLDQYGQSKVMAEQLLAWFGTQRLMETIALRIAPANTKAEQYGADPTKFHWDGDASYRRGAFFANCHPDYAADAIVKATLADGEFWYEAFNICDKYTVVPVTAFLREQYPGVAKTTGFKGKISLISPAKAKEMLGWQPCEDKK